MTQPKTEQDANISSVLDVDSASNRKKTVKRWLSLILLILIVSIGIFILNDKKQTNPIEYKNEIIKKGDLTIVVTATGNLEPTNQVDVGIEVSGTIETVEVDYNDEVKIGQILARLDTTKLEAQVLKSRAALDSAKANVLQAEATSKETYDELARLKKAHELSGGKVVSQQDLDTAEAALKRAQANVVSAKAEVSEANATLESSQTDLTKAVIYSPVNGIVLERSVEPGQTVAASFQAPVLFNLAEDLRHMELHIDVDEADVGQVKEGQSATFYVDAYPDHDFSAEITQVRFGSQEVDGVITYETILNVDNSDLLLRPGMTATVDIIVKHVGDVLLVPNTALRFNPPKQEEIVSKKGGGLLGSLLPRPPAIEKPNHQEDIKGQQQQVWMLRNDQLVNIPVLIGSTDGVMTEIVKGEVEAGMEVVIDTVMNTDK
jgi:HlyD family secretion protein